MVQDQQRRRRLIRSFGENRIYHVIIQYNKEKNIIESRVSDNLHEKNYFVCSGIWYDIGTFENMNRLILVVREDENAYIEGYIDNVSLAATDTTSLLVPLIPANSSISAVSLETSNDTNTTSSSKTPPPSGVLDFWMIAIALIAIIAGVAGTGFYVWQKSWKTPPPEQERQRVQKLHQSVGAHIASLEFFSGSVRPLFEKSENLLLEDKYQESEKELLGAEKRIRDLEKFEITAQEWKKEGFDLSPLLVRVNNNPDDLIPAFNEFKSGVARSREFEHELADILREHQDIIKEEKISRIIEWIQQNIKDLLKADRITEEFKEIRQWIIAQETTKNQTKTFDDLFDSVTLQASGKKQSDQIEAARKDARDLLAQAEKIGTVPEPVYQLIQSSAPEDVFQAAEELVQFKKTARPRLTLSLNRSKMEVHVWHRVNIAIENTGNAHALDVNFSFSREFETRWIRPKSINAGKMETFESIAIKPTIKGEVPLEISLTFHDTQNNEYTEKEEFFIDVTESATPHTPAYSPEATPSKIPSKKQLPPELTPLFIDSQYIGRGGFARVFKATKRDGKNVAIKVPISIDPSTGRTFVSEIQNWTKMVHENIVKVYDYNIMPPYFEMELCDESLANLKKPVPNEKAAWLVFSICEGLKYAHSQHIIHRDLKPQNILLKNGIPKISDWGLSRIMLSQSTTSAAGSFTLNYAAPEQVNNRKQDARTDLWQLGVIFYELTTGTLPFKGETVTDTIIAIATQNPVQPSTINPEANELDSIVMRCLEKDPAKRYQSALELQKEIGAFLKMNYTNSLNESLLTNNYGHSADYCADLLLVNMKLGGMVEAYKYASDLVQFVSGELKAGAEEFANQLKIRMEMNLLTIPDELINKADILVHKIKMQRK